jgi:predicted ribosome quality control (RQC) complex YloA/Tae2 family protein
MDGWAIAASLAEVRRAVEGGVVRSIYQPTRDVIVVHVFSDRLRRVLVSPKAASVHLTELDIMNPSKPSVFAMLLRKHLRGGRVTAVRQVGWDRVVALEVERRDGRSVRRYEVIAELIGPRGNLVLVREGDVLGAGRRDSRALPRTPYLPLRRQAKLDPMDVPLEALGKLVQSEDPPRSLMRSIDGIGCRTAEDVLARSEGVEGGDLSRRVHVAFHEVLSCLQEPDPHVDPDSMRATFYPLPSPAERTDTFAGALDRVLELSGEFEPKEIHSTRARLLRARSRGSRTAGRLRAWLDDGQEAEELRRRADLLMIHRADVPRGAAEVALDDPEGDESITIKLNSSLTAIENAQRLYERVKRLRRGRPRVEERLARIEQDVAMLEDEIRELEGDVPPTESTKTSRSSEGTEAPRGGRSGPRRLEIGGRVVYVGRNARQNDQLLREAAPDDIWLHARGYSGSHVVVRRGGRREVPPDVLREAARLAAVHSKGKKEKRVDVTVALVKNVRKPRRAPPGLVIVRDEDTLTVELQPSEETETE